MSGKNWQNKYDHNQIDTNLGENSGNQDMNTQRLFTIQYIWRSTNARDIQLVT